MSNIFRELSLQVHPDIAGNTSVNNGRMRQVIQHRSNQYKLIDLAKEWGIKIEGIEHVYIDPYEGAFAFRTYFGSIFILENRLIPTANKNVSVKNIIDRQPDNFVGNKFRSLQLIPNYDYNSYDVHVLLRNRSIFKVVELNRTTAKCLYGTDIYTKETKRYNVSSLLGRRVIRKRGKWC